jgi:2-polyprenyl-3-methyl-5-hydroxy-6-metoxy-1,4-benzoquinol methylase
VADHAISLKPSQNKKETRSVNIAEAKVIGQPQLTENSWSRSKLLDLLHEERNLILERALAPGADPLPHAAQPQRSLTPEMLEGLEWYLDMSKEWGILTLNELFKTPPGALLDIGAYYGLIAGSAWRNGWKVSAVDVVPIPNFSALAIPERQIDSKVCNASVDELPYKSAAFDAVLLNEVLEHLLYPPTLLFNEIRRVLKPGGRLYLTTPNPAALSKLLRLARGKNNEPFLDVFMMGETFTYKGLTFFKSVREVRIWTAEEIAEVLAKSGLHVLDHYYYGNTLAATRFKKDSILQALKVRLNRWLRPLIKRNRLLGGGTIVIAEAR